MGGRDLVWEKDLWGYNALHWACSRNASLDVVKELIEAGGGRDYVWEKDVSGRTPLSYACQCSAYLDVVKVLIDVGGGRDIVWEKDDGCGFTSIHYACEGNEPASVAVLDLLIQHGGQELIVEPDSGGDIPLQNLMGNNPNPNPEESRRSYVEKASYLINKGIQLQIGGQYSIGGLFPLGDRNDQCEHDLIGHDLIYMTQVSNVPPTLEQVMAMPNNRHLPILQAMIVNKAPEYIIKSAVRTFVDSINTRDSFDKYPIHVAVEYGLSWDDGLEQIVEAFASAQQTAQFSVCIKYGVQWENGMRNILENSDVGILENADTVTGLYPFMTAAVGGENYGYDFDSVFHLIKSSPLLVKQFSIQRKEKDNM